MAKPFVTPFATGGDKSVVPDASQADGSVSYTQGFGPNYQQEQGTPGAKDIPRDKTNQLFADITGAIAELQRLGFPEYYEELAPYPQGATVWRAGTVYMSTAGNNNTIPGAAGSSWLVLGGDTTPVGTTIMFNSESPPPGYAIENGLAVNRAGQYSALFSVIGTKFGAGNGSTTFNLPNSGGRFPRLTAPGQAIDPGRAVGSNADGLLTIPLDGWGTTGGSLGTVPAGKIVVGSGLPELSEDLESLRAPAAANTRTINTNLVYPPSQAKLACIKF